MILVIKLHNKEKRQKELKTILWRLLKYSSTPNVFWLPMKLANLTEPRINQALGPVLALFNRILIFF